MQNSTLLSHLKLHLIVFIYGFTAILGKLIGISAIHLVWYRVLIATMAFLVILKINKTSIILPVKEMLNLLGVGIIVAAHWITFFGAVKLSNVSVTLGILSTTALFTSLIEPIYFKTRLKSLELVVGLLIIIGLYLIFQFETSYRAGILTALVSSALAGWFVVLNRKLVLRHRARIISFYEMLGGFLGISLFLLFSGNVAMLGKLPSFIDFIYLLILGIVCTAFAFTVQVDVMKQLTAFVVSLTINLEPIYGIILAFFIFGDSELMTTGFYLGTSLILLTVFGYPAYLYFLKKKSKN